MIGEKIVSDIITVSSIGFVGSVYLCVGFLETIVPPLLGIGAMFLLDFLDAHDVIHDD